MKRALSAVVAGLGILACSSSKPAGGLIVTISAADVYAGADFDTLMISVGSQRETRSGADIALPTSIAVTGQSHGVVKIEVRALLRGVVRHAAAAMTKVPTDRTAILPIVLSGSCRDRCVQVGSQASLTEYCKADTLACTPEADFMVNESTLQTYDPSSDALVGLQSVDCGGGTVTDPQMCNGADVGNITCTNLLGEASTGDVKCLSCRSVGDDSCTNGNGLQANAPWPILGRSNMRQGLAKHVGPKAALAITKPIQDGSIGGALSSPVIAADGTVWVTSNTYELPRAPPTSNFAGVVVAITGTTLAVFQPDPVKDCKLDLAVQSGGSKGCRWSTPIVTDDDSVWTMTNTGEGFRFPSASSIKTPQRTISVLSALSASCKDQTNCNVTQLGPQVRRENGTNWAYVTTGAGLMVFKGIGSPTTMQLQQPIVASCPSWGDHVSTIGPDGTLYISLQFVFNQTYAHYAVCAVDAHGGFLWMSPDAKGQTTVPVIGPDGLLYFGSTDHRLYALDPYEHKDFKWTFATGGATTAPAFGADDTLYVGSTDEILYAVGTDRSVKWTLHVSGGISAAPIVDADGTIYIATADGHVYGVNPNGTILWQTVVTAPIVKPGAIAPDGTLWLTSLDGFIFAIK